LTPQCLEEKNSQSSRKSSKKVSSGKGSLKADDRKKMRGKKREEGGSLGAFAKKRRGKGERYNLGVGGRKKKIVQVST